MSVYGQKCYPCLGEQVIVQNSCNWFPQPKANQQQFLIVEQQIYTEVSLEISHSKADGSNDCLQIAISKCLRKTEVQCAIWQTAVRSQPSATNLIWALISLCVDL